MARMGRPPVENPKVHNISCRLNEKQYARLKEYSRRYGVTLTQVIQDAVGSVLDSDNYPGSVSSVSASERGKNGDKKRQQRKGVEKGGNLSQK